MTQLDIYEHNKLPTRSFPLEVTSLVTYMPVIALSAAVSSVQRSYSEAEEVVSFPDHFSPHRKNWSGEQPIPLSFPAVAKIVT